MSNIKTCVEIRDIYDCIQAIPENKADIIYLFNRFDVIDVIFSDDTFYMLTEKHPEITNCFYTGTIGNYLALYNGERLPATAPLEMLPEVYKWFYFDVNAGINIDITKDWADKLQSESDRICRESDW